MTIPLSKSLKVDCTFCPIRHKAVCSRCEPDELLILNEIKYYRTVSAGQLIALRGERLDYVASVVSGVATLSQSLEDGRTQMVGLLLPSDFIGRPGRTTVAHDITAAKDLTLCCFQREPFEKLLLEMPPVRERLMEMLFDEIDAARDWMLLLGRKTAREKVASFIDLLLRRSTLHEDHDASTSATLNLPITRETMANYLGLTIETVSRQLTALTKDGIISFKDKRVVIVPDIAALKAELSRAE